MWEFKMILNYFWSFREREREKEIECHFELFLFTPREKINPTRVGGHQGRASPTDHLKSVLWSLRTKRVNFLYES